MSVSARTYATILLWWVEQKDVKQTLLDLFTGLYAGVYQGLASSTAFNLATGAWDVEAAPASEPGLQLVMEPAPSDPVTLPFYRGVLTFLYQAALGRSWNLTAAQKSALLIGSLRVGNPTLVPLFEPGAVNATRTSHPDLYRAYFEASMQLNEYYFKVLPCPKPDPLELKDGVFGTERQMLVQSSLGCRQQWKKFMDTLTAKLPTAACFSDLSFLRIEAELGAGGFGRVYDVIATGDKGIYPVVYKDAVRSPNQLLKAIPYSEIFGLLAANALLANQVSPNFLYMYAFGVCDRRYISLQERADGDLAGLLLGDRVEPFSDDFHLSLVLQAVTSILTLIEEFDLVHNDFYLNNTLYNRVHESLVYRYRIGDVDYWCRCQGVLLKVADFGIASSTAIEDVSPHYRRSGTDVPENIKELTEFHISHYRLTYVKRDLLAFLTDYLYREDETNDRRTTDFMSTQVQYYLTRLTEALLEAELRTLDDLVTFVNLWLSPKQLAAHGVVATMFANPEKVPAEVVPVEVTPVPETFEPDAPRREGVFPDAPITEPLWRIATLTPKLPADVKAQVVASFRAKEGEMAAAFAAADKLGVVEAKQRSTGIAEAKKPEDVYKELEWGDLASLLEKPTIYREAGLRLRELGVKALPKGRKFDYETLGIWV